MTVNPYELDDETVDFVEEIEEDTRKPLDHYIEEIAALEIDNDYFQTLTPNKMFRL